MLRLLGRRLVFSAAALLVLSAFIFSVTDWLPRYLESQVSDEQAVSDDASAAQVGSGLDRPPYEQYFDWLLNASKGEFGNSSFNNRPIADFVWPRLRNTLFLAAYAAIAAIPLAVILGILGVVNGNGILDRLLRSIALAGASMPEFFVGYAVMLWLAVQFQWFPAISTFKDEQALPQHLHAIFLPMLALVVVAAARMMRAIRTEMLDVMASRYIETALLKGLTRWRIVVRHALPNALAPIINVIALNLAYLIVGVVVVEAVFTYNGLGRLMVDAVSKRDVPVVQACGLIFAIVFISLNLIADVLSILSNPRLRHPR